MSADGESLLMKAFPRNMFARVRFVADWTRIDGGVSVTFSEIVIIDLAVYELKKGSALLPSQWFVVRRRCMACPTVCVFVLTSMF